MDSINWVIQLFDINSRLHLSNKLKECRKFFSHFIIDSEEECAAAILIAFLKKKGKPKKKRSKIVWVKPCLARRNKLGVDNTLLQEFRLQDEYKPFLRMTSDDFNEFENLLRRIFKSKTNIYVMQFLPK